VSDAALYRNIATAAVATSSSIVGRRRHRPFEQHPRRADADDPARQHRLQHADPALGLRPT
jgi:hypothetical protein